jgi:hypothetical protein
MCRYDRAEFLYASLWAFTSMCSVSVRHRLQVSGRIKMDRHQGICETENRQQIRSNERRKVTAVFRVYMESKLESKRRQCNGRTCRECQGVYQTIQN